MDYCVTRPSPVAYVRWTGSNKSEIDDYMQNVAGWAAGTVDGAGNYAYTDGYQQPQAIPPGYYMLNGMAVSPADFVAFWQPIPSGPVKFDVVSDPPPAP